MDDLKRHSLDELIERVMREHLIDACERQDDHIVIVQGPMRFVLNPARAHAFLRGVIKGMSAEYRRRTGIDPDEIEQAGLEGAPDTYVPDGSLVDSFRRHLLKKWWVRYDRAGSPFGRSSVGLMLWVRHNTGTTSS